MLENAELATVAHLFGVADTQVCRDHFVSHLLGEIARLDDELDLGLVFYGGTALARTHLDHGRLSEDVDLFCTERKTAVAALTDQLPNAIRRTHGVLHWEPPLSEAREIEGGRLLTSNDEAVRLQVIQADAGYRAWPTERRSDGRSSSATPTRHPRLSPCRPGPHSSP